MITTAQICGINIYDADGALSFEVSHTVAETINIKQYGVEVLCLERDEAQALIRALTCLLAEPDMKA